MGGGEKKKKKKKKRETQYALGGNSLTQQVETNQQQALVACLGGNILIPWRQIPKTLRMYALIALCKKSQCRVSR